MTVEELKQMAELKKKGFISEEEFQKAKESFLSDPVIESEQKKSPSAQPTFGQYISKCFVHNYININGRASRAEFFSFFLFSTLISLLWWAWIDSNKLSWGFSYVTSNGINNIGLFKSLLTFLSYIPFLIFYLPNMSVLIRRLHDSNSPGTGGVIFYVAVGILNLFINIGLNPKSNLAIFLSYLIFIFGIGCFIIVFFKSDSETNRFGPVPD